MKYSIRLLIWIPLGLKSQLIVLELQIIWFLVSVYKYAVSRDLTSDNLNNLLNQTVGPVLFGLPYFLYNPDILPNEWHIWNMTVLAF